MLNIIHCITSAPILYCIPGYDLYDSFDRVSQGIAPAPLASNGRDAIRKHEFSPSFRAARILYAGTHGQTHDTALLLRELDIVRQAQIIPTSNLDGIRFALSALMSKAEFFSLPLEYALAALRERFIRQLYRNALDASLNAVCARIDAFIAMLKKSATPAVCIGHNFFLRLMELRLFHADCFSSEAKLLSAFHPEQKPYKFLSGFDFSF